MTKQSAAERIKAIEESHRNKRTYPDADHVEFLIARCKKLTEVAQEADSYLSLIYHRHSSNLPNDLREEIGRIYSKARKALEDDND